MVNTLRVDSIVALTVGKSLATKRQCIHLHVPLHAETFKMFMNNN